LGAAFIIGKVLNMNHNDTHRPTGLYLITDHGDRLVERVSQALCGGVTTLQYRNKGAGYPARLAEAGVLQRLCAERGVTFIINDDLRIAVELDSDGVHLGQEDGSIAEARRLLGSGKIIGVSTHSCEEALRAEADGADYIGFGAMYPTGSKEVRHMPGPAALATVKAAVGIPVVAIGGINRDNAGMVIDAGADAIAVIAAVLNNADPGLAAAELALLFNRRKTFPRGSVLTVAGSDSGGGAGIQADIKTITLLGSYAASVITALTAQNTLGVSGIHAVPALFVAAQLEAVFSDIPVDVVKTGMLFSREIIATLADKLTAYDKKLLVLDPVMVAKGGSRLIGEDDVATLVERLLPLAFLVTPNVPEAEALTGVTIVDEESMHRAAQLLLAMGARNVLIKGGHLPGQESVDILFNANGSQRFSAARIATCNTHGTGCSYASAIAAFLAQGEPLPLAVARSKQFITTAIGLAVPLGGGHGPVNHFAAAHKIIGHIG
jgi:hydroxymethylpyrimidine kinase / phosphomethylpyrimidine kinase / thiamine-phosphate diphosphorylase